MFSLSIRKLHSLLILPGLLPFFLLANPRVSNNQPPVAVVDGPYIVHRVLNPMVPNILANDFDPDGDPIHIGGIGQSPAHGSLTFGEGGATFFNVSPGYVGPDSFTYRVCDDSDLCSPYVTVTIDIVNQAPIATGEFYIIRGATPIGSFLANDSDPEGDPFNPIVYLTFPSHGGTSFYETVPHSNIYDAAIYTPNQGYVGTDSFTYKLCDDLQACSSPVTITLLVVGDGENDGTTSCNLNIGGPINVSNGNMYLQQSDYQLPSVGYGIKVARTYNSGSQRIGLFGRGWSTAYDESILAYDNNLLRFNQGDGRAIYFGRPMGSSGTFTPVIGDFHAQLTKNGSSFTLTLKDGSVQQFNSAGKLLSLTDRNGNTTALGYGGNGFLSSVTDPFGRVLTITTNSNGRVTSISDSMGTVAAYTYGGGNELLSVTYADNSAFHFSHDGNFRLTTATDALGNIVESHTYDGLGRALTSEKQGGVGHYSLSYVSDTETDVTDALSHVTKYTFDKSKGRNVVTRVEGLCNCEGGGSQLQTWTYNDQLNVTSKTDALGHVTFYTYDSNGNRLTETDAVGTVTYTYNEFAEVLTHTDQLNGVTANTYDGQGNLLTTNDALSNTTTFTYNARGQMLTARDARGKVTTFTYDSSGNLTRRTDANNITTAFFYDARSRLSKVRDGLSRSTLYAYDPAGRVNKITHPDLSFVSLTYDMAGRQTMVTDERGNPTNYAYDGAYRLAAVTDAANQTTSSGYDAMSNLTSTTDALSRVTNYEYDDLGRLVKITYPPATSGATRLFEALAYDAVGNVTQRTDTAGRATSYAYDNVNRVSGTTDADNKTTSLHYDALSRVTGVLDALNQQYQFAYDALGRQTQITRGGVSMSYAYDAVGNRTQRTDYNGVITSYAYDNLNRLIMIVYPTRTVTYGYDPLNNLTRAANENGTLYIAYDNRYRVSSFSDPFFYGVSYNYDVVGNRTKLKLNGATYATYTYDAVNRLTSLKDGANLNFAYSYDPADRLTSRSAPNGVTSSYGYDDLDRLTSLMHTRGAMTLSGNLYTYNNANHISSWTTQSAQRSYTYDTVDRLTGVSNFEMPTENYSYDAVGNRTSSHLSASYGYQPFNRLSSTANATYSYDNNGNLVAKTDSLGAWTFGYDEENRLTQVSKPSGPTVNYKYDGLGRRIQRTTSAGANERYVYDGHEVLIDLNADWSVATSYLSNLGIDNHLRQTSSAMGVSYLLTDHLGSTAALTDAGGNLVEQESYDSFGDSGGSARTRYGYTGRERDPDTGMLYYRARFYDPQLGRFVGEDPIGFNAGQMNFFAYVGNNPTNSVDPSGLWGRPVHMEIIREAFKCLSESQREHLANSNDEVDGLLNGGAWREEYSYQHGMRAPWETVDEARKKADDWINGHMGRARDLAPNGCRFGGNNIPPKALDEFGLALHTIMDMTSPSHEGFQVWHGLPYPTGITAFDIYRYHKWKKEVSDPHSAKETLTVFNSDPVRRQAIIAAARDAFKKAFGDCCCTR